MSMYEKIGKFIGGVLAVTITACAWLIRFHDRSTSNRTFPKSFPPFVSSYCFALTYP